MSCIEDDLSLDALLSKRLNELEKEEKMQSQISRYFMEIQEMKMYWLEMNQRLKEFEELENSSEGIKSDEK